MNLSLDLFHLNQEAAHNLLFPHTLPAREYQSITYQPQRLVKQLIFLNIGTTSSLLFLLKSRVSSWVGWVVGLNAVSITRACSMIDRAV